MNVFRREMRANYKSLLVWVLVIAGFNVMVLSIYPSFAADSAKLEALLSAYPEQLTKIFGLDRLNLGDPLGFFGTEIYFMVLLFGSIFAAILGAGLLAKEEDEKTIEFLLARPVTRARILADKVLTYVVCVVAFNILVGALSYAAFAMLVTQAYSVKALLLLLVAPVFVHLTFASLGFLMALFFTRRRAVYSVTIGLVVGLYFLGAAALLARGFEWLKWLSPFRYVDAANIVTSQSISVVNVLILLAVNVAAVAATYALYRRRDIMV